MKLLLGAAIISAAVVTIVTIPFSMAKINNNETVKISNYIENSIKAEKNGNNIITKQENEMVNENQEINNQNNQIQNLENKESSLQENISSLNQQYNSIINSIGPNNSSTAAAYDNAEFVKCIRSVNSSNENEVNQLIADQNQVEGLIYDDDINNITAYEPTIKQIENSMITLENQILS